VGDTILPAMACLKEVEARFVVAYSRQDFTLALRMLAAGRIAGPAMITDHVGMDALPRLRNAAHPDGAVQGDPAALKRHGSPAPGTSTVSVSMPPVACDRQYSGIE